MRMNKILYIFALAMTVCLCGCAGWGTISVYKANTEGQMELTEEYRFVGKNIKAEGGETLKIETKDLIPDLPAVKIQ